MAATVIVIADAVVAALNAATLSQTFTAVRAYVPVFEVEDLETLRVTVVPRSLGAERLSRRDDEYSYVIDVAVQKRVIPASTVTATVPNSAVDPYMLLTEEIADLFRGVPLAGYEAAANTLVENDPIYMPDHLSDGRIFTSVVRLTFKEIRARP